MAIQVNETAPSKQPHLNYLDGIRGLSALYVVLHHVSTELNNYQNLHQGPARLMLLMSKLFSWGGHDCVTIFICLSGFSLTIPLAKSGYQTLLVPENLRNYFIRRALRIAPPYFFAIAGVLFLAAIYPGLSIQTPTNWSFALPILDLRTVLYHIFFVHALEPSQVYRLSPQFWSIGTEAQLYFWLPIVIVPFAVKKSFLWGIIASLIACLILIPIKQFDRACLHYVFTFSLGAPSRRPNLQSTAKRSRLSNRNCLARGRTLCGIGNSSQIHWEHLGHARSFAVTNYGIRYFCPCQRHNP